MSLFAPREHADKLADAMGAGADAESARLYAGGAVPLRAFLEDGEAMTRMPHADAIWPRCARRGATMNDSFQQPAGCARRDRVRGVFFKPDRAAWLRRIRANTNPLRLPAPPPRVN